MIEHRDHGDRIEVHFLPRSSPDCKPIFAKDTVDRWPQAAESTFPLAGLD
jgi:hypothetical protein